MNYKIIKMEIHNWETYFSVDLYIKTSHGYFHGSSKRETAREAWKQAISDARFQSYWRSTHTERIYK